MFGAAAEKEPQKIHSTFQVQLRSRHNKQQIKEKSWLLQDQELVRNKSSTAISRQRLW